MCLLCSQQAMGRVSASLQDVLCLSYSLDALDESPVVCFSFSFLVCSQTDSTIVALPALVVIHIDTDKVIGKLLL